VFVKSGAANEEVRGGWSAECWARCSVERNSLGLRREIIEMKNAIRSLVAFSALVISMQAGAAARNAASADGAGAVTGVATYHARTTEIEAGHSRGNVALEDTTWRVTRLNDKDVVTKENQHAPYIVLASSEHRASGSGGCNRINGTYTVDKQTIHFGPMASTMMACPDGMDTEKDFMEALDAARKWKIQGDELELYGEDGNLLVRFKASESK
jgi:copper homeostasis protein (lipoprotein)